MTENPVQTPVPGSESDSDGPTATPERGSAGEPQKSNKEARYRVERNEARAERDALAQRVERMQRAEVERLASDKLSHPADLFSLSGNELADYLTESGDVDADKVAADVAALLAERPGLRKFTPGYDPSQGLGGKPPKAAQAEPSFADLFKSTNQPY
jgi:hypothetical protein